MGFVRWVTCVAILSTLPVIVGCEAITGMITRESPQDAALSETVKEKLSADKAVNLERVDVKTNNGTVTLSGAVPSLEARERAIKLAWQVTGVKTVVDHLRVGK